MCTSKIRDVVVGFLNHFEVFPGRERISSNTTLHGVDFIHGQVTVFYDKDGKIVKEVPFEDQSSFGNSLFFR